MAGKVYNLGRMNTPTTGTGTITLSTAVTGYLTFAAAGATNGQTLSYAIVEGNNREVGTGTYSSTGPTLTRTVSRSTNSNNPIVLQGLAQVAITPNAANFDVEALTADFDLNGNNLIVDDNHGILDDSNNELLWFQKVASAANYVEITNAAAGSDPIIAAVGSDTNIDLDLRAKGTGGLIGTFTNTGLAIRDVDASHWMALSLGSNITGNRTFTFITGDANRRLEMDRDVVLRPVQVLFFTSSGTWTKDSGCQNVLVTVVGGGGGGGAPEAVAGNASYGMSGGGGGTAIEYIDVSGLSDGATVTVTVGAGGSGGTAAVGGNSGTAGGTSQFGGYCSATGGAGGGFVAAATTANISSGAFGGGGTLGNLNIDGASGQPSIRLSGTVAASGNAGGSTHGTGGRGVALSAVGVDGNGYGGGGSGGATNSATTRAGGAGTDGMVMVIEFY